MGEDQVLPPDSKPDAPMPFVGGEVVIQADPQTGAINVKAPGNNIIAMGLIEAGKMILMHRAMKSMDAQQKPPTIVPGSIDMMKKLQRPS